MVLYRVSGLGFEGTAKKVETATGYVGTTIRIHSLIPS